MKKTVSLILALAMMLCLSVTAFAQIGDSGQTVVTTTVPNTTYYTLHIPASTATIPYGEPRTYIGDAYVTDVKTGVISVYMQSTWTALTDGTNTIPFALKYECYKNGEMKSEGECAVDILDYRLAMYRSDLTEPYCTLKFYIEITDEDWAAAAPGEYKSTITWTSSWE